MPELPEVETIIRYLRPHVEGRRILKMESDTPRLFRDHKNFAEVRRAAEGKRIRSLGRIGKNILFYLSDGSCLAFHLMMTGSFAVNPPAPRAHDRMSLLLSGKTTLVFNDIRKFGRCRIIRAPETLFGKDALVSSAADLKIFQTRQAPVKSLLLDQSLIAGIGNIYADEALWHAGVHPARPGSLLTDGEIKELHAASTRVLKLAINKEGTTSRNYQKPDGTMGGYYDIRKAYHRTGTPCARDGALIRRIVIGQRATHFCPKHQK